MASIPVPNTAQLEIIYNYGSVTMENVLNFTYTGGAFGVTELQEMADTVGSWVFTYYAQEMSAAIYVSSIVAKSLDPSSPYEVFSDVATPFPGTVVGNVLPSNICALISLRTGTIGRAYRGRVYMPGLTEGDVTANSISPTRTLSIYDAFDALGPALIANAPNWHWVVVSRYLGGAPRVSGVTTEITSFAVSAEVKTQRRRLL